MQRSKTMATWLALLGGTLGLHRLYLRGLGDVLGWLHLLPTTLGLYGLERWRQLGQDDSQAWWMLLLLGLMISQAMLHAILYGLTPDERWAARWGAVLGVIAALLLGTTALMSSIAFGTQKFFEWELAPAAAQVQADRRSTN